MNFNDHSTLAGRHAFLSASNYHWINYTDQKLEARWHTVRAAVLGTQIHAFAMMAIQLGIKQARTQKTLNMYVNDAIGYQMTCEQPLRYSDNAFGTADTISFRRGLLRIHDLKTGITPCSFNQLLVYAALFCLEYEMSPFDIEIELRIYQRDEVLIEIGNPEAVLHIMDKIVHFDMQIELFKERSGA
jgi:hypothetical protein